MTRLDILTDCGGDSDTVTLSEIYANEPAFETHLDAPHIASFKQATADSVEAMVLHRCDFRENEF